MKQPIVPLLRSFRAVTEPDPFAPLGEHTPESLPVQAASAAGGERWIPLEESHPEPSVQDGEPLPRVRRFVDGAALRLPLGVGRDRLGRVVHLGGAAIGAMAATLDEEGHLLIEPEVIPEQHVRLVVALPVQSFEAGEVEELDAVLRARGIHLLRVETGEEADPDACWERILGEMQHLERRAALGPLPEGELTVIDGPLGTHSFSAGAAWPLVGVIKGHQQAPLSAADYRSALALRPGQRSRAFRVVPPDSRQAIRVTWYLKLAEDTGVPLHGTVRLEVHEAALRELAGTEEITSYLNRLSESIYRLRAVASGYRREHCSLDPIVELERMLHAQTPPRDELQGRVLRALGLTAGGARGGEISSPAPRPIIGRVLAIPGRPATPDRIHAWLGESIPVERGQYVTVPSTSAGSPVVFYGVIEEMEHLAEGDEQKGRRRRQGDPAAPAALSETGTTLARIRVLRTDPDLCVPPQVDAPVWLATHEEAGLALSTGDFRRPIPVGLLRNGSQGTLGPAFLELDFLLGPRGAHLNVNGISGVATKTSAIGVTLMSLLQTLEGDPISVVPLLFNVKGSDLYWIDRPSRDFQANPQYAERWREMGLEPRPFRDVAFLAPAREDDPDRAQPIVPRDDLIRFAWGLEDVIARGLLPLLCGQELQARETSQHLIGLLERRLRVRDSAGGWKLRERKAGRDLWPARAGLSFEGTPQTFAELLEWLSAEATRIRGQRNATRQDTSECLEHIHMMTIEALCRRLHTLEGEHGGVLAWSRPRGRPPRIVPGVREAFVVDIAAIGHETMRRFAVAAVLEDLVQAQRAGGTAEGVRYVIALDELNRWAARGREDDPTRQLFERIAGEMRSQGIILFGAQQLASRVSEHVVQNAGCRMIGRTDTGELQDPLWRFLSESEKAVVAGLAPGEQLLHTLNLRAPVQILLPHPCWATAEHDAVSPPGPSSAGAEPWMPTWEAELNAANLAHVLSL